MTLEIILEKLELNNFRDITGVFDLDPKTNEFRGQNGVGKTTFIDSEKWLKEGKNRFDITYKAPNKGLTVKHFTLTPLK